MSSHVYKHIEITGASSKSMEDAVQQAIARASKSVRGMSWFEVTDSRGSIENDQVAHWQVTIKIGFRIDD